MLCSEDTGTYIHRTGLRGGKMRPVFAWGGIRLVQQYVYSGPHCACSGTPLVHVSNTRSCLQQLKYFCTQQKIILNSLPQDVRENKTGFWNGFKKRLGKSVENRSASATKKEAGHAAGEPWGRLCNRVRRGRFAGAQQGCRISLVSVFSYSFEYRSVQIQQQEKKHFVSLTPSSSQIFSSALPELK